MIFLNCHNKSITSHFHNLYYCLYSYGILVKMSDDDAQQALCTEKRSKFITLVCKKIINFERVNHAKLIYNMFFEFTQFFPVMMYRDIVENIFQITRNMFETKMMLHLSSIESNSVFVSEFLGYYDNYCVSIHNISKMCEFLSRSYLNYSVHMGIKNIGKSIFRDIIYLYDNNHMRVQQYLIRELQAHRLGEMFDCTTVRKLLNMIVAFDMNEAKVADRFNIAINDYRKKSNIVSDRDKRQKTDMDFREGVVRYIDSNIHRTVELLDVSLYNLYFEREFLKVTYDYYAARSMVVIQELSCLDYLKWTKSVIEDEYARLSLYLPYDKSSLIIASFQKRKEKDHSDTNGMDTSSDDERSMHDTDVVNVKHRKPQKSGFVYDKTNRMNERHCKTITNNCDVIISALICNHIEYLINEGYKKIMECDVSDEIILMNDIFTLSETSTNLFYEAFGVYIVDVGTKIISDEETLKDHMNTIRKLISFYNRQRQICTEYFGNPQKLRIIIYNSFFKFININMNCTKLLVMYVDQSMKTGFKDDGGESNVDNVLNDVLAIYMLLKDKDMFESFYEAMFKKRLLGKKTASDDYEKMMIVKMKSVIGFQFSNQLEKMYTEIDISKLKSLEFSAYMKSVIVTPELPEMSISVLSQGVWKLSPITNCVFPPCIEEITKHFVDYYNMSHSKRRLYWQTDLGNAIIRSNCFSRTYELNVTTYQMFILDMFNNIGIGDSLSYNRIRMALNIPDNELKRQLISLTTPKAAILVKTPKGKTVNEDDVFTINTKFDSKKRLVKVPLVTIRSSNTVKSVPEDVESRRKFIMEAAIIRVMKSRKTLDHANLVAEVTKQVLRHFSPSPVSIKGRIGNLIDREYLERSEENRMVYNYLA